jgi:hypothetical protein
MHGLASGLLHRNFSNLTPHCGTLIADHLNYVIFSCQWHSVCHNDDRQTAVYDAYNIQLANNHEILNIKNNGKQC